MLVIKTNKNNGKRSYQNLNAIIYSYTNNVLTLNAENHGLNTNDRIVLSRNDGETIYFWQEFNIENVINNSSFTINKNEDYLFHPLGYENVVLMDPTDNSTSEYYKLNFDEEHIFTTNKDNVYISGRYYYSEDLSGYTYEGKLKLCDGDYVLYDDLFLLKYNLGEILNINDLTLTAEYNNEQYSFENCVIGVNGYGNDDRYSIYIPKNSVSNACPFEEEFTNIKFTGPDIRFSCFNLMNPMRNGTTLTTRTTINKVCGDLEVDFSIGDSFEVNLLHETQIDNYIQKIKDGSINKIIDYERQQFTPMYYSIDFDTSTQTADQYFETHLGYLDPNLKPINELRFNLYFREKEYTKDTEDGNIEYGTWKTDDMGYWNNFTKGQNGLEVINSGITGDLLGFLGFTDNDLAFQKDALKESFLRLSFYDSPNRSTQKLLYYSTIYLDTNVLNKNYINDTIAWRKADNPHGWTPYSGNTISAKCSEELVYAPNIENVYSGHPSTELTAQVFCCDKFDDTKSSDGFYLYLFKNLVNGNDITPIYMRAEFNNAKFGKTVPMIYPINAWTNEEISPTSSDFPISYEKTDTGIGYTNTYIDVDALLRDSYIKIYIKYNFLEKRFVWFFPWKGQKDMVFDLYEPRINNYREQ